MPGPLSADEYARREAIWQRMSKLRETWHAMAAEAGVNKATFAEWARRHMPGAREYRSPTALTVPAIRARMLKMADKGYATWRVARSVNMSVDQVRAFAAKHGIELNDRDARVLRGEERRKAREAAITRETERERLDRAARMDVKPTIAMRRCLGCSMEFESEWIGHRLCHLCKGRVANTGLVNEGSAGGRVRAIR